MFESLKRALGIDGMNENAVRHNAETVFKAAIACEACVFRNGQIIKVVDDPNTLAVAAFLHSKQMLASDKYITDDEAFSLAKANVAKAATNSLTVEGFIAGETYRSHPVSTSDVKTLGDLKESFENGEMHGKLRYLQSEIKFLKEFCSFYSKENMSNEFLIKTAEMLHGEYIPHESEGYERLLDGDKSIMDIVLNVDYAVDACLQSDDPRGELRKLQTLFINNRFPFYKGSVMHAILKRIDNTTHQELKKLNEVYQPSPAELEIVEEERPETTIPNNIAYRFSSKVDEDFFWDACDEYERISDTDPQSPILTSIEETLQKFELRRLNKECAWLLNSMERESGRLVEFDENLKDQIANAIKLFARLDEQTFVEYLAQRKQVTNSQQATLSAKGYASSQITIESVMQSIQDNPDILDNVNEESKKLIDSVARSIGKP